MNLESIDLRNKLVVMFRKCEKQFGLLTRERLDCGEFRFISLSTATTQGNTWTTTSGKTLANFIRFYMDDDTDIYIFDNIVEMSTQILKLMKE